jgi:hypothetical protein
MAPADRIKLTQNLHVKKRSFSLSFKVRAKNAKNANDAKKKGKSKVHPALGERSERSSNNHENDRLHQLVFIDKGEGKNMAHGGAEFLAPPSGYKSRNRERRVSKYHVPSDSFKLARSLSLRLNEKFTEMMVHSSRNVRILSLLALIASDIFISS